MRIVDGEHGVIMSKDVEWQDLMSRRGYIRVSKKALPDFWSAIQTNPDYQIVVFSVEYHWADDTYIIGGCSRLFEALTNEAETAPQYWLQMWQADEMSCCAAIKCLPDGDKPKSDNKSERFAQALAAANRKVGC